MLIYIVGKAPYLDLHVWLRRLYFTQACQRNAKIEIKEKERKKEKLKKERKKPPYLSSHVW